MEILNQTCEIINKYLVYIIPIINIIFLIATGFISYESLSGWWNAKSNHENRFYFGFGFLLVFIGFIIYIIDPIIHINGMNWVVHILDTFNFFFIINAIMVIIIQCDKNCSKAQCKFFCKRKCNFNT